MARETSRAAAANHKELRGVFKVEILKDLFVWLFLKAVHEWLFEQICEISNCKYDFMLFFNESSHANGLISIYITLWRTCLSDSFTILLTVQN